MKKLIRNKGGLTMKAIYRAALMFAAFVCLFPLSASAEIKEGTTELGVFGGYHFFDNGQNVKNRSVFGGRIGYNYTKHFALEGSLEFIRTRVDDTALRVGKEGRFISPSDRVRLNVYHVDALYHFSPEAKVNPFIAAGYGVIHYSPSISTKNMSAFNVGLGAKYWLSDNVAIRADLRDNIVSEIFQEPFHNLEATIGISIAVGGKAKPEPAQAAKAESIPALEPVIEAPPVPKIEPVVAAEPEPVVVTKSEPVIIVVSEPEFEKKVAEVVVQPKIEEKVIVLALEDIHFEFDSAELTPMAQMLLKKNLQILRANPKARVRIAGYTSASGTDEYNQKLSERRANAVKDYLLKEDVASPERLSQIGFGERNPESYEAIPEELYSPEAKSNMRVLFEIIMK